MMKNILPCFFVLFLSMSCSVSKKEENIKVDPSTKSIIHHFIGGVYRLDYPKGEIHLLSLDSNNKFRQEFYLNIDHLKDKKALYSNTGKWRYLSGSIHFTYWLDINDPKDLSIIFDDPQKIGYSNVISKLYNNGDKSLIFFDESGFEFLKVSEDTFIDVDSPIVDQFKLCIKKR